ncbi:MAG: glycoside hydrolase family 2 TIM barrel-domain containing protein [Opitutaceae bacterium]|jgi:beta-galactosidase
MKRFLALVLAGAGVSPGLVPAVFAADQARQLISMDAGWRFSRGDFAGAERAAFDDSSWRKLDVPHDWGIEGPFDALNPAGGAGAFLPTGVGWYRKHFTLPSIPAGSRIFVEFDGVMENSDVWINDAHLGRRPYGYVTFRYEITSRVKLGESASNVLCVRVNNADQPASRWFAGSGIYRHVRLIVVNPVHIDQGGLFVSTPKVSAGQAAVHVLSTVVNQSDAECEATVQVELLDDQGHSVGAAESAAQRIAPRQTADFQQDLAVSSPKLWDLDHPQLYSAVSRVRIGGVPVDDCRTTFGIRDAHFEAATGFWLNGKNIKIKGVCVHADGSAFGAAVPLDVWERRLGILKELGANAIRTAHNPPDPGFLDLCDRMGLLVMDEMFDCWTVGKNIADYHLYFNDWSKIDTRDTVRRDRNHPSIILYSAGNEIHDTPNAELSKRILSGLIAVFHENDPTRPVTQAILQPERTHDYEDGLADLLDVIGTNYRDAPLLAAHAAKPSRIIIGTENHQDRSGWLALRDNAPYSGQFLWSGIDYLGESRAWPLVSSSSGLIDRTGYPHPQAYEWQSWWSGQPVVHIVRRVQAAAPRVADPGYTPAPANNRLRTPEVFVDWTPDNTAAHDENVEVYSNAERVELFLNGQSLGTQPLPSDASPRTWRVAYAAGSLKAVASNHGQVVATDELRTAGRPAKIMLDSDRAALAPTFDAVATVTVTVTDANGVAVPNAKDLIGFQVTGPGVIAAVDSGDHESHESFQSAERRAYQGRCVAFVKASAASGHITLSASAPGLESASVGIDAAAP